MTTKTDQLLASIDALLRDYGDSNDELAKRLLNLKAQVLLAKKSSDRHAVAKYAWQIYLIAKAFIDLWPD